MALSSGAIAGIVVGGIFGLLLLIFIILLIWKNRNDGTPRGPLTLPLFGNLFQLVPAEKNGIAHYFAKIRPRFGDIFRVDIGQQRMIVVMGPKYVLEVLKDPNYNSRPLWIYLFKTPFKGKGVVFQNGDGLKQSMRCMSAAFKDLGDPTKTVEKEGMINKEIWQLSSFMSLQRGIGFNAKKRLNHTTANIMYQTLFGKRFDIESKTYAFLLTNTTSIVYGLKFGVPENAFPGLGRCVTPKVTNKVIVHAERLMEFLRHEMDEHRKNFDPEKINDFMDVVLKHIYDGSKSPIFEEENLLIMFIDMLCASYENMTVFLRWAFIYFINYPDIQKKCREELRTKVSGDQMVTLDHVTDLPYTSATIKEILRICDTLTFCVPHAALAESSLGGYRIPKDSVMFLHIPSVNGDKAKWGDPEKFRPERWINDDNTLKSFEAFIPFGTGYRSCPGQSYAEMITFLLIANLLKKLIFTGDTGVNKISMASEEMVAGTIPVDYMMRANEVPNEPTSTTDVTATVTDNMDDGQTNEGFEVEPL